MRSTAIRILAVSILACGVITALAGGGVGSAGNHQDGRLAATSIRLEPLLTSGLSEPLFITNARDGSNRFFIVEQPGRIKVIQPGSTVATVFLDITGLVLAGGERGLLGLAFHPGFPDDRRFYVNYTRRPDGDTVIAEYRVSATNPDVAETGAVTLLAIEQPFSNHNGGMIEFGPDGFLYIGTGDGGSGNDPGNRAQNIADLLGKILRIDVDRPGSASTPYSSPSDNPYFGPVPGRDEIFAIGLRNPWRFSFDRGTGLLYAGDVGQNVIEEIDIIELGGNYGWRVFEGTRCTDLGPAPCSAGGFIPPIAEYSHTGGRCSVTGGYAYRGSTFALPVGSYIYGDYCSGEIFLFENGLQTLLLDTDLLISSFGEDESGEIYVVSLGSDNTPGAVYRIVNASPPALTTVYYPRLVTSEATGTGGDDSEFTGMAVANLDSADATVRLTAYERGGAPIAGRGITNPVALLLRAGQQLPIVDVQAFGAELSARRRFGWIKLESTVSRVVGFFLFFSETLSILDGADVSSETTTSFLLPEIEDRGFTQVHVANPNPTAVNVQFELVGMDGMPRGIPQERTIVSNGAFVELLDDLFSGLGAAPSDYVRATAGSGVVAFESFGKSGRYVQGIYGLNPGVASTTLYAPQYVVGGGEWLTFLTVINVDQVPGSVTLELFSDAGAPIGDRRVLEISARGKIHIRDQRFFLDPVAMTQGYVRITSNGPRLAGSVVFGDPERNVFSSSLPLVSTLLTSMVYSQLASNETYFTGLALLNPGDGSTSITVEVNDSSGSIIVNKSEILQPRQRKAQLLTQFFPSLAGQNFREGYFKVSADRGIASFALFGTRSLSVLSAIPPQRRP